MNGCIVSGKDLSTNILKDLANYVEYQVNTNFERRPKLVVVTIGEDPASKVYVRNKEKACEKVGIIFENIKFTSDDEFSYIYANMKDLVVDSTVDGIIV